MTDVVAAALIAGGVAVAGNVATVFVALRSAATSIRQTETQADVELAKVSAENERLREEHREAERQHRQGTYHRLISALDWLQAAMTRVMPIAEEDFANWWLAYQDLAGGVKLFGDSEVNRALDGINADVFIIKARVDTAPPNRSLAAKLTGAFQGDLIDRYFGARESLIEAMRRDVAITERDTASPSPCSLPSTPKPSP